ncbi:kelch-like protein diablo [Actinia tenebrosa]|uniref:Kelch-like protein diablo n=1 Tax=Actinia tenebrosa TaxID=6105 RepID=A0A6P8H8R2_ACTTE|nr:kelch-like protein diablo [Actinia tenebrosa]
MNCLLKSLNSQRQSNILCDVVLVVKNQEFPAHKGILAANSNYFMAMFTTNMVEKIQTRIDLKEMDPLAIKSILDFIYTGELKIDERNVRVLLEASNFLFISAVKDACCHYLGSVLEADNCLTIMSIADEFFCEKLHHKALNLFYKEFLTIAKHEDFMNLNVDEMIVLLSSDEVRVESEDQMFEVLANWISYDLKERKKHLARLMPLVRLDFIEPGLLENNLMYNEIAKDICTRYSREMYGRLEPANPRKSYSSVDAILVIGGVDETRILETVSCYIPCVNKWCELGKMNVPRWRLNVTKADSTVFAVGGLQEVSTTQKEVPYMERYDHKTDQWEVYPTPNLPFPVDCSFYNAVGLGSEVIFIQSLDSTQQYPRSSVISLKETNGEHVFAPLAAIPRRRAGHCIAALSDHVYVIGGSFQAISNGSPLGENAVDRYDRESDSWSTVTPMNQQRCDAVSVSSNGKIFVFGGCHGTQALRSAEVYDPETNHWTSIAPMSTSRINAGIAEHSGKIWIIGGKSGPRGPILSSIECYDPSADEWTNGASLPDKRQDFVCCMTGVAYRTVASMIEEQE